MDASKAAEDVLEWMQHGHPADVGLMMDCAENLARAYLAEHDTAPIADCYETDPANWRDEWLLSVGFKPHDEQDFLWINAGVDAMFDLQAVAVGPWLLADEECDIWIPRPKTRGDVRRLCAALGIELGGGCDNPLTSPPK